MIDWINNNKEWFFSGAGVSIVLAAWGIIKFLVPWFKKKDSHETTTPPSNTQNQTQNVTVNVAPQAAAVTTEASKLVNNSITIEGMKAQTNILFIDDDKEFKIVNILRRAGWKNTSFLKDPDVKDPNTDKIKNAHIIFVDILGVGKTLYAEEGLGLVADLKKRYPEKKVVFYSANPKHEIFSEAMKVADDWVPKNEQPAVFVSMIETFAEQIWKNA